jgi:hypothetical protein
MNPGVADDTLPLPGITTPGDTVWVVAVPEVSGAGGARVASATVVIDWDPERNPPDWAIWARLADGTASSEAESSR